MILILAILVLLIMMFLFWNRWRKSTLALLAVLIVFCLGLAFVVHSIQKQEFGEHLATVDWLPSSASDISFTRSYIFTAYEFTMGFDEFLAYAGSKNWHMTKVDTQKGIYRYLHALKQSGRKVEPSDAFVFISAGHSYDLRQSNGGGVSVIYDSNNKRAYVTTSPR